jgi:hypothetical protein
MSYEFTNLRKTRNVQRGIAEYALLALVTDFEADGIKAPVAPFTNKGDSITIKTAHVFKTDKGFIYHQLSPQKNSLSSKAAGDPGLASIGSDAAIFIPGSDAEVHEQMQELLNVPLIILVKDAACKLNLFYQLGCDCTAAYLLWDFATADTKTGNKGFTVPISYEGAIQFYDVEGGPEIIAD